MSGTSQLIDTGNTAVVQRPPGVRVIRSIKQWIQEGRLAAGEPLPSERALAERLQVARGTVRSAMEQLLEEGFITGDGRRRTISPTPRQADSIMSHTIGVLTTTPVDAVDEGVPTGWERYIDSGAMDAISERGLHGLALAPSRLAAGNIRRLLDDPPAGVLFSRRALEEDPAGEELLKALHSASVPVVVYGQSPTLQAYDRVASDHSAGAEVLTRWLIGQGRRRILRMWPFPRSHPAWLDARDVGHERAMRAAGLDPLPALIVGEDIETRDAAAFELARRMMAGFLIEHLRGEDKVDALMLVSDATCYPAAAACRLLGAEPGRDVLIAGYDNYYAGANGRRFEPTEPAVTIDKRNLHIGREMVALLMQRIEGNLPDEPQVRLVEPKLVITSK